MELVLKARLPMLLSIQVLQVAGIELTEIMGNAFTITDNCGIVSEHPDESRAVNTILCTLVSEKT